MTRRLGCLLVVVACTIAFAACDDNKRGGSATTRPAGTETAAATRVSTPAAGPTATEVPFQGARQPIEATPSASTPPLLVDIRVGEHEGYDRMAFEFDGDGLPGFSVQYVTQDQVVGCASGAPELVLGDAYLQVRFTPANAHDEQGNQSFDPGDQLPPGFTSLFDAILTCDFEAEVTWVFGLAAEVDFRVLPLRDPPRLAVDVAH